MVLRTITFKIEEELLEKLDRYARRNGLCRSEAIRKAIELLVNDSEKMIARIETKRLW